MFEKLRTLSSSSLRGAKRRSNPDLFIDALFFAAPSGCGERAAGIRKDGKRIVTISSCQLRDRPMRASRGRDA
jgi:hypothetical protein